MQENNQTKEKLIADDADRLMSLEEVALRLKTSPPVVRKIIDVGLLSVCKFRGGIRRVRKVTFNKFLDFLDGKDLEELLNEYQKLKIS